MPEMTTHFTPPIGAQGQNARAPIVTPDEELRQTLYREKWMELAETGWIPASVVNLCPWDICPSGVLFRELRIAHVARDKDSWAAAPMLRLKSGLEVPYTRHVFLNPEVTVLQNVVGYEGSFTGNSAAHVTQPNRLAIDVVIQHNTPVERGGVFWYAGDVAPEHIRKAGNEKTIHQFETEFEKAHSRLIDFCNRLLQEGNDAHGEKNIHKIREITKYHRWGVRYLRLLGLLPADPEWLSAVVHTGKPVSQHCVCGAEVPVEAIKCVKCNHVLKPFEAFDQLVVDLETPGARLMVKRMSMEQIALLIQRNRFHLDEVQEMGLYLPKAEKPNGRQQKHPEQGQKAPE